MLGCLVICPSEQTNQRIISKIDGFLIVIFIFLSLIETISFSLGKTSTQYCLRRRSNIVICSRRKEIMVSVFFPTITTYNSCICNFVFEWFWFSQPGKINNTLDIKKANVYIHGLRTPREEIAFTARPKIHSQIFTYGRSIFCLPHRPKISDFFDLCFHWVSVVRVTYKQHLQTQLLSGGLGLKSQLMVPDSQLQLWISAEYETFVNQSILNSVKMHKAIVTKRQYNLRPLLSYLN